MSEERFDRLDQRLDGVDQRLDGVEQRLGGVEHRLDGVEQRLDGVEQRLDGVGQRLDGVGQRLDGLEAGQTGLRTHVDEQFAELRRHMGVLHEEALDRIAGTREAPVMPSSERAQDSRDAISRRLDPLEALVPVVREHGLTLRSHGAEIERLKRRRK